jgi:hypothetical protein
VYATLLGSALDDVAIQPVPTCALWQRRLHQRGVAGECRTAGVETTGTRVVPLPSASDAVDYVLRSTT